MQLKLKRPYMRTASKTSDRVDVHHDEPHSPEGRVWSLILHNPRTIPEISFGSLSVDLVMALAPYVALLRQGSSHIDDRRLLVRIATRATAAVIQNRDFE